MATDITDIRSPVPLSNAPRLPNIKALTSVRFFAALHVALYHLVRPFTLWGPLAAFMGSGYVGVSFFFILSGFILTYSHALEYQREERPPSRFWIARFARIYPLYLVSLLYGAWFYRSLFHQKVHIVAFVADLFALQSWSIRAVNFFNVPAWSISVEAFFYLVFPFLLLRMRPPTRKVAIATIALFWAVAMALPVMALIRWPGASWSEAYDGTYGTNAVFAIRRIPLLMLPEFLAGVTLGWLYLLFPIKEKAASWIMTLGLCALGITLFFGDRLPFVMLHNGLLLPLFAVIILGLCGTNWLSRLMSNTGLVLLGEASFALYLIHFNINDWLKGHYPTQSIGAALIKLAFLIPVSVLLHLYLERPGRRIILNWWKSRQTKHERVTASR